MRIIAGTARGVPLTAPRGADTRPTQDKVKESLFNILQWDIAQSRVLDLFAGSGSLALESLSRGAESAVMVDQSREAIQCIRRNVEKLRFQDRAQVLQADWKQALQRLSQEKRQFDVVFLDPPYRMEDLGEMCDLLYHHQLLPAGALVVWERRNGVKTELSGRFLLLKQRAFGDTEILIYQCLEED